jgi:cysteinyl-tRNA synthetase
LVRVANAELEKDGAAKGTLEAIEEKFRILGGDVLGIINEQADSGTKADDEAIEKLMQMVIEQRDAARKAKDFNKADEIRGRLDEIGIVLEDKPEGTAWRWK